MTDPDAGVTSYQYDNANRLTGLTNPFNETTGLQYDAVGRLTRQNNANGTYGTWTFDAAGQVTNVATRKSNDTVILNMAYTRDAVGNPTQLTDQLLQPDNQTWEAGTWTFGYDNIDRLTLEKRTGSHPYWYEYTMDGAGNRTQFVQKDGAPPGPGNVIGTTNATYSADNRLLTYGNTSYTWDQNGNQLTKTTNQVTVTYGWNYDNKLVSLTDGSTMSFTYNADGLRQSKTVDGTTTRFIYSGVRLLQETNSGGTTQATYTLAPIGGEWEPLVSHRKSGASRFYAFDVLGTTRALTDGNEDVAAVFTDDAWGNVLAASDTGATPHQYVGRYGYYANATSGLMLLTQRYYDGGVGRFVSEDSKRSTRNWLWYGDGSPAAWTDNNGTGCRDVVDWYCSRAGTFDNPGQNKAYRCLCKVSGGMCNLLVRRRGVGRCACNVLAVGYCGQWLDCMGACIQANYANMVAADEKITWGGATKPLSEWCKAGADERLCCYAHSIAEKKALQRCRDNRGAVGSVIAGCAQYRQVDVEAPVLPTEPCCPTPRTVRIRVDCAQALEAATSLAALLSRCGILDFPHFPYTGSLDEMIQSSNATCCDSDWPDRK